jgi:hypothetical protein
VKIKLIKSGMIAGIYAAVSVVLGPLIAITAGMFTRGGLDYEEGVYQLPSGGWDPARDTEFGHVALWIGFWSILGIATGLLIIYCLVRSARARSKPKLPFGSFLLYFVLCLVTIVGYMLLYAVGNSH